jgi:hypothetical protein
LAKDPDIVIAKAARLAITSASAKGATAVRPAGSRGRRLPFSAHIRV